jgi:hypothetical protein
MPIGFHCAPHPYDFHISNSTNVHSKVAWEVAQGWHNVPSNNNIHNFIFKNLYIYLVACGLYYISMQISWILIKWP